MRLNEQLQDRIAQYVAGLLPPPEAAAFEQEMQQNEALQAEVQLQREVHTLITLYGKQQAAKSKIAQIAADAATEEGTKTISMFQKLRPILAIAAILVLAAGVYFIFSPSSNNPQELFAQHFSPYANTLTVRGVADTSSVAKTETEAMQYYQNQQYPQAAAAFDRLTQMNPKDQNTYDFYGGISLLANLQTAEAMQKLQTVAGSNNPYQEQAEWYIALAYLQNKNTEKAKELLQQITAKSVHDRKADAQDLLKSL
ncbi:hypothetical protein C7N43_36700 [Sphingobacteriales bacterium UPWRP_1]|nr:hypothetical protein BVG80_00300 [Sphingobacteriales bacterium TSM_CSM]PSJ71956.1 hypothetical protein C7N43_36700 [Sphingobacteriales bacterium UPWRP_1]